MQPKPNLPASVPRKFGVGTLLVVSTAYAILFAILRAVDYPAAAVAIIGIFLTLVGVGQMICGQAAARWGSMAVGAVTTVIITIIVTVLDSGRSNPGVLVTAIPCAAITGIVLGYLGGALVAGVFLITDWADRLIHRKDVPPPEASAAPPASAKTEER